MFAFGRLSNRDGCPQVQVPRWLCSDSPTRIKAELLYIHTSCSGDSCTHMPRQQLGGLVAAAWLIKSRCPSHGQRISASVLNLWTLGVNNPNYSPPLSPSAPLA